MVNAPRKSLPTLKITKMFSLKALSDPLQLNYHFSPIQLFGWPGKIPSHIKLCCHYYKSKCHFILLRPASSCSSWPWTHYVDQSGSDPQRWCLCLLECRGWRQRTATSGISPPFSESHCVSQDLLNNLWSPCLSLQGGLQSCAISELGKLLLFSPCAMWFSFYVSGCSWLTVPYDFENDEPVNFSS